MNASFSQTINTKNFTSIIEGIQAIKHCLENNDGINATIPLLSKEKYIEVNEQYLTIKNNMALFEPIIDKMPNISDDFIENYAYHLVLAEVMLVNDTFNQVKLALQKIRSCGHYSYLNQAILFYKQAIINTEIGEIFHSASVSEDQLKSQLNFATDLLQEVTDRIEEIPGYCTFESSINALYQWAWSVNRLKQFSHKHLQPATSL